MKKFKKKLLKIIKRKANPDYRASYRRHIDSIIEHGIRSYKQMLKALKSADTPLEIRWDIMAILRYIEKPSALATMLEVAYDSENDMDIRTQAINTIGSKGDKQAVKPLMKLLQEDSSLNIRRMSVMALGWLGDKRAREVLIQILMDTNEDERLRGEAAEALSSVGGKKVIPYLIDALQDPSADVRFWSAFALGQSFKKKAKRAIPILEDLAANDHWEVWGWWSVSKEARDALENLYRR